MKINKMIIINILLIILIVLNIVMFYRVLIENNIYRKFDFLSFRINSVKDYSLCKNSVENYLNLAERDFNSIQYFVKNFDRENQKNYSKYLANSYTSIIVSDIKKSLDNVYVVYYYRNRKSENLDRMVLKFSGNHYYVLYDSIYESYKEAK